MSQGFDQIKLSHNNGKVAKNLREVDGDQLGSKQKHVGWYRIKEQINMRHLGIEDAGVGANRLIPLECLLGCIASPSGVWY